MNPVSAAAVLLLGVTAASAQSLDDLKSVLARLRSLP